MEFHRKSLKLFLAGFVLTLLPGLATAGTVQFTGTEATGITGLTIDSITYNIVFGATSDTTFSTSASAADAVNAIDAALNTSNCCLTVKNTSGTSGFFYVTYGSNAANSDYTDTLHWNNIGFGSPVGSLVGFTVASSGTPEPGTWVTLALGLGGIGWWKRRQPAAR